MLTFKILLPYLLITFVTLVSWYSILYQSFLGEGFYYFDLQTVDLTQNDVLAKIIFSFLPSILKDNIPLYFAFQLIITLTVYLVFYRMMLKLTDNKLVSLIAVLLFIPNFVGSFEMLGAANYQRFAQRVPVLIPLFISFIFLVNFQKNQHIKSYLYSLAFFTTSVFLGHFSTFLLPIFILYLLISSFNLKNLNHSLKALLLTIPFITINLLTISQDHLNPAAESTSLKNIHDFFELILFQFTNINIPSVIVEKIASVSYPYTTSVAMIAIPIIIFYSAMFFVVYKKSASLAKVYLIALTSVFVILSLNLYVGKIDSAYYIRGNKYYFSPDFYIGRLDNSIHIKGDRAYFIPTINISVIWAILLWTAYTSIGRKGRFSKAALFLVMLTFIAVNIFLISQDIDKLQPNANLMKKYLSYIKSISGQFTNSSLIITQNYLIWPSPFIRRFYGYPEMRFLTLQDSWQQKIKETPRENIFMIDYNFEQDKIVDLTDKFRVTGNYEPR